MKFLKPFLGIVVWFLMGAASIPIVIAIDNKPLSRGDLVLLVTLGGFTFIIASTIFMCTDKVCALNCGVPHDNR